MKKSSSFLKGIGLLAVISGAMMGTVSATSLVTPQTIICASTFSSPVQLKSLSIGVYYDNKPLTGIGTPSENGTCVKVDRDWLLGGAQPGTSFFITGKDKNNQTYLLENRDIAMFNDVDMKEIGKISLNYDVNNTTIPNTTLLVGTVKSELYIYDAGGVKIILQKGIYRSDMQDVYALDTMRQIGATKYTKLADFKSKDTVTREQAAKFFVATWKAIHSGQSIPTTNTGCAFNDGKKIDPSLVESIYNACQLGLMKGSAGAFNPQNTLTLAEAVTVLIRMQYGKMDETNRMWYRSYFDQAYNVELFAHFAYNPHLNEGTDTISREMLSFLIRRLLEINNITLKYYNTI